MVSDDGAHVFFVVMNPARGDESRLVLRRRLDSYLDCMSTPSSDCFQGSSSLVLVSRRFAIDREAAFFRIETFCHSLLHDGNTYERLLDSKSKYTCSTGLGMEQRCHYS